jgi:flagellar biosynthesis protein FlhF
MSKMQVEKITAPTMADAMKEVKRRLGDEAVILETRTRVARRWWGLRKNEYVEVTAGLGVNVPPRRSNAAAAPTRKPPAPVQRSVQVPPNVVRDLTGAARAYGTARNGNAGAGSTAVAEAPAQAPGKALLQTPAAQSVAMMSFTGELNELKSIVKQLVGEVRHRSTPQVPDELFEHYMELINHEVSEELATDVVRRVQQNAKPEQLANAEWVRERIVEQIEKIVPVSGPIERRKPVGPHIVALIGPTGVGKTTTVAKLAANLKLRERKSVGLITIDTYRIAAIDQLRKYAELIGVVLQVVSSPEDIAAAIEAMSDCEYVLIDTAGRSPSDALKLNELKRFLDAANPDEIHLVLSTTCGKASAQMAIERFGPLGVDKVICTKVDEAAQLGVLLSVCRKLNKGLSYITTGQDVPDDIEVTQAKRLARLILGDR